MAIDKTQSVSDSQLESILTDIHQNAVGQQFASATPTVVPDGKLVIADDGAGTESVSVKSAEGNIITLTPAVVFPSGVICMWSGSIASIPSGWVICDGNNSTPNLTNRFVYGANEGASAGNASVGSTGGRTPAGNDSAVTAASGTAPATDYNSNVDANSQNSTSHTHDVMPPYYALAFIMKT